MDTAQKLDVTSADPDSSASTFTSFSIIDNYFSIQEALRRRSSSAAAEMGEASKETLERSQKERHALADIRAARERWAKTVPSLKTDWLHMLQSWRRDLRHVPTSAFALAKRGIPPSLRGIVWYYGIGNAIQVTPGLFTACQEHLEDLARLAAAAETTTQRRGILKVAPTHRISRRINSSESKPTKQLRFEATEGSPRQAEAEHPRNMFMSKPKAMSFSVATKKPVSKTVVLATAGDNLTDSADTTTDEDMERMTNTGPTKRKVVPIAKHLRGVDDRERVPAPGRSRRSKFGSDIVVEPLPGSNASDSDASDGDTQLRIIRAFTHRGSIDGGASSSAHPMKSYIPASACLDRLHRAETSGPVLVQGWVLVRQRKVTSKRGWVHCWCLLLPRSMHMYATEPLDDDDYTRKRLGGVLLDTGIVSLTPDRGAASFEVFYPTSELSLGIKALDSGDAMRWIAAFRGTSAVVDRKAFELCVTITPRFVSTFNGGSVDIVHNTSALEKLGTAAPAAKYVPVSASADAEAASILREMETGADHREADDDDDDDDERVPQSVMVSDVNQFLVPVTLDEAAPPITEAAPTIPTDDAPASDSIAAKLERVDGRPIKPHEQSLAALSTDLSRTFPEFAFFAEGSDVRDQLHRVLSCYAMFRPDHGYVQGFSHVAAMLLVMVGSIAPINFDALSPQKMPPNTDALSSPPRPSIVLQSPKDGSNGGAVEALSSPVVATSTVLENPDVEVYIPKSRKSRVQSYVDKPADSSTTLHNVIDAMKPKYPSDVLVFICFANLLSRAPLRWIAGRDVSRLQLFYRLYSNTLNRLAPKLHTHFETEGIEPNLYLLSWLLTLFSKPLGLEVSVRLWDRCVLGGTEEVLRCALALALHLEADVVVQPFDVALRTLANVPVVKRNEFAIGEIAEGIRFTSAETTALIDLECAQP